MNRCRARRRLSTLAHALHRHGSSAFYLPGDRIVTAADSLGPVSPVTLSTCHPGHPHLKSVGKHAVQEAVLALGSPKREDAA